MVAKRILFGQRGRARVLSGVRLLAGAVGPTLGPAGRNVLLQRPGYSAPLATKDGVTVAEEIELADSYANMGAQLVLEGAAKTSFVAGDGTTTAILLAHALFREGARLIAAGHHPIDLTRGMDLAVDHVCQQLGEMASKVDGKADVLKVAAISANGDREVAEVIAQAVDEVGRDGIIHVEQGTARETKLEVAQGTEISRGFASPYFITDAERLVAVLDDPFVFLYESKISRAADLLPVLEKVRGAGGSLLVVAEVEGEALSLLVLNKVKEVLKVCAVHPPSYGQRRNEMLMDLGAQTGARAITDDSGLRLADVVLSDLGRAKQVIADHEKTRIMGGAARKGETDARTRQIRAAYEATNSAFDHQMLDERLRKLVGGAVVIRVGAATDAEASEKKMRFEDAVFATRAALEEGVVAGGGVALVRAAAGLSELVRETPAERTAGVELVRRACEEPCRRIAENAGQEGLVVLERIRGGDRGFGYNAADNRFEDLVEAGVLDPARVVRLALKNAASVATMLLSAETFVVEASRAPVDHPTSGGTGRDALSLEPFLSRRERIT
jgi:chaperonin GroEL